MPHSDADWILVVLLDSVITLGVDLELTLFVDGLAVSGKVVTEPDYLRAIGFGDAADSLKSDAHHRAEIQREWERDDLSDDEKMSLRETEAVFERQFVEMVDVTITGAGSRPLKAKAWRGRLSQVSAWVIGTYEDGDES
jgi:hypothetical protein